MNITFQIFNRIKILPSSKSLKSRNTGEKENSKKSLTDGKGKVGDISPSASRKRNENAEDLGIVLKNITDASLAALWVYAKQINVSMPVILSTRVYFLFTYILQDG